MGRFNNDRFSRRGRSERPMMHDAVCDECGQECQVPFKPSSDKPIYCSRCFEKHDTKRDDRGGDRRDSRPSYDRPRETGAGNTRAMEDISRKLDRIIQLLENKPEVEEIEIEKEEEEKEDED